MDYLMSLIVLHTCTQELSDSVVSKTSARHVTLRIMSKMLHVPSYKINFPEILVYPILDAALTMLIKSVHIITTVVIKDHTF